MKLFDRLSDTENCSKIFTLSDLQGLMSVWSEQYYKQRIKLQLEIQTIRPTHAFSFNYPFNYKNAERIEFSETNISLDFSPTKVALAAAIK